MAGYKVYFKASVEKDLSAIQRKDLRRILQRIEMLTRDPRPQGHEKLTGLERYRIRQDRYRIVYSIQDEVLTVWIAKVGHQKDVPINPTETVLPLGVSPSAIANTTSPWFSQIGERWHSNVRGSF